jgi:hypothetical protein
VPEPEDEDEDGDIQPDPTGKPWSPYRCAAGIAVFRGRISLLEAMKLKADTPIFQRLYEVVHRPDVYDFLFDIQPPRDPERVAHHALSQLGYDMSLMRWDPEGLFKRVLERGGRLTSLPEGPLRQLQGHLRSKIEYWGRDRVRLLQDPARVDEAVFLQIIQSPKLIDGYKSLGIRKEFIEKVATLESASSSVLAAARRQLRMRKRRRCDT